jgi:hypothetical protein
VDTQGLLYSHLNYAIKESCYLACTGEILLQTIQAKKDIALFWSHNKKIHPNWLDSIVKRQVQPQFVWWDVAWSLRANLRTPLTGYIWSTVDRPLGVTHKVIIENYDPQPTEKRLEEARRSWIEAGIRFNENSPLLLYKKKEIKYCTLLKLSNFTELKNRGKLNDFIVVSTGMPPPIGPRSRYIVFDPHLL